MIGKGGLEIEIDGVSETLIVGIGGVDKSLTWIEGGSGKFMVGITGAEAVGSRKRGLLGSVGNALSRLSQLTRRLPRGTS